MLVTTAPCTEKGKAEQTYKGHCVPVRSQEQENMLVSAPEVAESLWVSATQHHASVSVALQSPAEVAPGSYHGQEQQSSKDCNQKWCQFETAASNLRSTTGRTSDQPDFCAGLAFPYASAAGASDTQHAPVLGRWVVGERGWPLAQSARCSPCLCLHPRGRLAQQLWV